MLAVIAAIAFFTLRAGRDTAAVAAPNTNEDPALSASGEAMIVGDVMPIDSNEPGLPPGTAQPPFRANSPPPRPADSETPRRAASETPPKQSQVYEARRQPDQPRRQPDQPPRAFDPAQRQSELDQDCATQRAEIRWSKRFEPSDGAFDDATRLSLIRDLGIVRAPWGVPLLTQAYEEEPAADHRRAALRALAAYRHPDTQPTFELALRADDEETRSIAANALTALSIRAALPS
ncbi:MAG TPA: HEAT repeat domain-containing protein [Candidatus Elarobacter sp.]